MALRLRKSLVVGAIALTGLGVAVPAIAATTGRSDKIKTALSDLVTDGTLTQQQADKVADTLATVPLGDGRGGPGGHGFGAGAGKDAAAVAEVLGLTEDQLRTELQAGKSLATIAGEKEVPVATVVNTIVAAEKARIAEKVASGDLTQAQADERLADLTARVTERVNSTRPAGGPGRDGRDGRGGPGGVRIDTDSAAVAKVLGLTEDQLRTELRSGKSLAAVAAEKKVAVSTVVSTIVDETKAAIATAVEEGRLTQAQADERLEDLTARVTERVNSTRPAGGPGGRGHGGPRGEAPGGTTAPSTPATPAPTASPTA